MERLGSASDIVPGSLAFNLRVHKETKVYKLRSDLVLRSGRNVSTAALACIVKLVARVVCWSTKNTSTSINLEPTENRNLQLIETQQ